MAHSNEEGNEMWNPLQQPELNIVEQPKEIERKNPFSQWIGNGPIEDEDGNLVGEKKPENKNDVTKH